MTRDQSMILREHPGSRRPLEDAGVKNSLGVKGEEVKRTL